MARTPLLRWLSMAARKNNAGNSQSGDPQNGLTMTRREFLKAALGTALGTAALSGGNQAWSQLAANLPSFGEKPVIIVGGGLAGLTTAYRLMQHGVPCTLYEASSRLGGRVFSKKPFNAEGMFVELGGELVDTCHTDLIDLCQTLDVPLEAFASDEQLTSTLYCYDGKLRNQDDVIQAFTPLANAIAADLKTAFPQGEVQVPTYQNRFNAQWLDEMSLEDYLEAKRRAQNIAPWLIHLIKVAYTTEYGLDCKEQSALNLALLIGCEVQDGFRIYGDSDEAYRIRGGNSQLVNRLAETIQASVPMRANHRLTRIEADKNTLRLRFRHAGRDIDVDGERVVLALPLPVLRKLDGLEQLPLSPVKKRFIREMGYGTNSKQMIGFKERFWRQPSGSISAYGGELYSDWTSQTFWETSRLQPGKAGILTNFLGGETGKKATNTQWQTALRDLALLFPDVPQQFDGNTAFFNWSSNPLTQGSYVCPKPGQYTAIIGCGLEPELDGRLYLAGEHCSTDWMGYMNGAVDSGNQVAQAIVTSRQAHPAGAAL